MATASSLVTVTSVQPTLVMRTSSRAAWAGAVKRASSRTRTGMVFFSVAKVMNTPLLR